MVVFKADEIENCLVSKGLNNFFSRKSCIEQDNKYIVFHGNVNYKDFVMSLTLDIDNTEYNSIYYKIGKLNNSQKRYELLEFLNQISATSLLLKYYLVPNSDIIMAKIVYCESNEDFNANYFVSLIEKGLFSINQNCKNLIDYPFFEKL